MAGAIKLLQYQLLAYWRKSFSKRGNYDKFSFFLVLIILLVGYRFALLLKQTAKSLSEGNPGDLNLLLGIAFFVWILPAFESQKATEKLINFLYLPLTKNQFSLINLANIFLVPTSIIAVSISLAMIYPLAFSSNFALSLSTLFFYSLFAAFSLALFVRLLKLSFFRPLVFLTAILLAAFSQEIEINSQYLPHNLFTQFNISNILLVVSFAVMACFLAFLTIRQTISVSTETTRRISPRWLSKVRLPIKFGELIKKDFFASWKTLDAYIALLVSTIYIVILLSAEVTFFSFSIFISILLMMNGSLVFNIFGLENSAGFQRLSLLPVKPEDLLKTKNKVFAFLIFSQTFFVFPLIFDKLGMVYLCLAILKTIGITLFYLAWGNHLSVKFPFKMNFYEISFGGSLQDMMSAVFLITLISIVPDFFLRQNGVAIWLANISLIIFSVVIYRFSLRRVAGRLSNEWENIASKL